MIITCPNCNSEYDILKTALGEEGREVKCAKCKQKWLAHPDGDSRPAALEEQKEEQKEEQEAEIEESPSQNREAPKDPIQEDQPAEEISEPATTETEKETEEIDIPDAVKPPADREAVAPLSKPKSLAAKMAGYCLALLIFGALIVTVFLYKNKIVIAWPPAALFYEMAGSPVALKGEGLIVESLSATVLNNKQNQDVLIVKGRVVNLTADAIEVPKIQARLRSLDGRNLEQWIIDAPVDRVEAGESFAFTSEYPNAPAAVGSVNLMFIPTLK